MYKYIVVGCSAGSGPLIKSILTSLPKDFVIPIIFVRHVGSNNNNIKYLDILSEDIGINIKEAEDKELLETSTIYMAPAGYHLLMEQMGSFSLTLDEKVNFNRPSIDLFFESIAYVYGSEVVGIILSGANSDGAFGLKKIKESGGMVIVQDPETAEFQSMPISAIKETEVDHICPIKKIISLILELNNNFQQEEQ